MPPRARSRSKGPKEEKAAAAAAPVAATAAKAVSKAKKDSGGLVTSAPPSWQLIAFWFLVFAASVYYASRVDFSANPPIEHTPTLKLIRGVFAASIFLTELHEIFLNPAAHEMTTYKPPSKLRPARVDTSGFRQLTYFTHWSWVLLGTYFALTALSSKFDTFAFVLWEVASSNALLVSAVVTFVIWPEKVSDGSDTSHLASWPVLMMHNANTLFVAVELAYARTGIRPSHGPVVPLYGLLYVLFLWRWSHVVQRSSGVQFYYFFLDTTLPPAVGVAALAGLLAALGLGFLAVSGASQIIESWNGDQTALWGIVGFMALYICKWAD